MDMDSKKMEELTVNWTQAQSVISAFISSIEPNIRHADDILQAVAIAVVQKYHTYDSNRSFVAWAIGIAKNEILMVRRKHARDRHIFNEQIIENIAVIYEEKADEFSDMKAALGNCVTRLQDRWKEILKMRYSWGLDVKQIAKQLGASTNSIFVILHRIRLVLRDCIQRQLKEGGL